MQSDNKYVKLREKMVKGQMRDVKSKAVLDAIRKVPRHLFVPKDLTNSAYDDGPLPIGHGQTISQPYIVALMTELLELTKDKKVLEIGTGSGYQTAILAELALIVYTIEIVEQLVEPTKTLLKSLDCENIVFKYGDGYHGWVEEAPFDAIMVTAAPAYTPEPLLEQLNIGGRMVIPVGEYYQELILVTKTEKGIKERNVTPVRFVPMTGEAERRVKGLRGKGAKGQEGKRARGLRS